MKKLKLELDELTVESFEASAADAGEGTVRGHDFTWEYATCRGRGETCDGNWTCWDSCDLCGSTRC